MDTFPELPSIPWGAFGPQLTTIAEAITNKLDREWPERYRADGGAQALLEMHSRFIANSFHTIKVLSLDDPPHPLRREDALSVAPLSRSILDALFTTILVLEDVPGRSRRYFKSGWRENSEEFARHNSRYSTDPQCKQWLGDFAQYLRQGVALHAITPEEEVDLQRIPYWPNPSQALKDNSLQASTRARLQYLYDWFYRSLSSHSHVSSPGLVMRSAALLPNQDERRRKWNLDKQISDQAMASTLIVLAFVSEIELHFKFGLATRIQYVWTFLRESIGMAQELYDPWYSGRFVLLGA